jgi:hypothetical protein
MVRREKSAAQLGLMAFKAKAFERLKDKFKQSA